MAALCALSLLVDVAKAADQGVTGKKLLMKEKTAGSHRGDDSSAIQ